MDPGWPVFLRDQLQCAGQHAWEWQAPVAQGSYTVCSALSVALAAAYPFVLERRTAQCCHRKHDPVPCAKPFPLLAARNMHNCAHQPHHGPLQLLFNPFYLPPAPLRPSQECCVLLAASRVHNCAHQSHRGQLQLLYLGRPPSRASIQLHCHLQPWLGTSSSRGSCGYVCAGRDLECFRRMRTAW